VTDEELKLLQERLARVAALIKRIDYDWARGALAQHCASLDEVDEIRRTLGDVSQLPGITELLRQLDDYRSMLVLYELERRTDWTL